MNTLENLLAWKPSTSKKKCMTDYIKERDFPAISKVYSDFEGTKIQERRNELKELIKSGSIVGEDFWYFLESLLVIDSHVYRKPISDAVVEIKNITAYAASDETINKVARRMLSEEGKVHQALGLLSTFRNMLPGGTILLLKESFPSLTDIDQIKLALDILRCNTLEEKLDLLATNESVASIYLGIEYIYTFRNTKLTMLNLKNYPEIKRYLGHMHGSFAKRIANDLIMKTSFGDNTKMKDLEAANYLVGGFTTFEKGVRRHEVAVNRKAMSTGLKTILGEEVTCKVSYIGTNFVIVGTDRGYAGVLPKAFFAKEFDINSQMPFPAKVVKVLPKDNYLVVSQRPISTDELNRFTLTTTGELIEVRFKRQGTTFVPTVLGHGPVKAIVVSPKKFDYKQKYRAQVMKVNDICNCEIRLLHTIATKE